MAKFAAGANIPFLLLQLPQILLNGSNRMDGNKTALLAISWLVILTGLLGNLSLLSYFAKKKETEAMIVQCLGVIIAFVATIVMVIMARTGKLSEKGVKFVGAISGWSATLLFMWMPIAQMVVFCIICLCYSIV